VAAEEVDTRPLASGSLALSWVEGNLGLACPGSTRLGLTSGGIAGIQNHGFLGRMGQVAAKQGGRDSRSRGRISHKPVRVPFRILADHWIANCGYWGQFCGTNRQLRGAVPCVSDP
jgi:hypothetical protein